MDVTITVPGQEPIHTTTDAIEQASRDLRQRRSQRRLRESMQDSAGLAQDMANAGLISQAAATETKDMAQKVADKLAPEQPATRFAKDQLKAIVERIIRLEDEKKTFADDIKEVYGEAKSNGFDTKALRRVVKLQRMDQSQKAAHDEVETILETYMQALGML